MGRRKKKSKRINKVLEMVCDQPQLIELDTILRNQGAKDKSKLSKKLRKKLAREQLHSSHEKKVQNKRWHKISVESSMHLEKKFLLESLANYVDVEFTPLGFHSANNHAYFYLDNNSEAANSIRSLNRRIQGSDGNPMKIDVILKDDPDVIPNANQLILIKEAIVRRIDSSIPLLDLSAFHLDPCLMEKDILVPLSNTVLMKSVMKIVKEIGVNLRGLNLNSNCLNCGSLKFLEEISLSSNGLSAINLENNNLQNLSFLNFIKMFPVVELNLNSNPALKNAKNTQSYINSICKAFPNLKMLDNTQINKNLHCSPLKKESATTSLGFSQGVEQGESSIAINGESLRCFLEQYFLHFDTPQRMNLVQAYVPGAKVTIHSNNPHIQSASFEGLDGISNFLSSLPETKHAHSSFNLSIVKIGPHEGCAEVSGMCLFAGLDAEIKFVRQMIVVPYKAGLCCSMDMIEIK